MKYLAFDIEAANGYKPSSICSIGVVIADEQFNILSRTNYWINPKTKYNLNGTRRNVGINLHLDKQLLDNSLDFSQMYDTFRALFTDKQYVVVGHAVDADVRMLNAACERYGLPSIDFSFICSQLLYKLYFGEKEVKALNKIAAEMGVEFEQHNSEEDALVSLLTLKYLVEKSGMSLQQLMQKYHYRAGSNNNFELIRPASLDGQVSKRQQTQILVEKIKNYAQTVQKQSNLYKGKVFCLARSLELSDSPLLYQVVEHIVANGGRYTAKLAKCNVYVFGTEQTDQDKMRENRVAELQQQNILNTTTIQQLLMGGQGMTAKQFLMAHNQSTHNIDCNAMLNDYLQQMKMGLSGQGSIPMIPTYLTDIDRSKIKGGKRILIDAGGTNFRSALGYFDEEGNVVLEKLQKTIMPASDRYLTKEEFYAQIASNIAYLAEEGDNVGFCFSYQVDMDRDVDGVVVNFSKEVKAPQVVGTRVGKETLLALKAHSDKNRGIVILNDTVATLLGGMASSKKQYSAYVGYIYGTGTNLCYIEDTANIAKVANLPQGKMLINTESGNYNGFAQGDFDKIVANSTANPNGGLLEKMSSGKYLSDVIYQAFVQAQKEGLFVENVEIAPFVTRDVSDFVVGKGVLNDLFTNQADKQFAMDICVDLIDRAAKIGAIINSGAVVASCTEKALPAAIVAEGTTFNKLVGFRSNFEKYLTQILGERGISYEIIQGDELNLVGTLMATMVLN